MTAPKFAAGEQAVVLDPRGHTYVRVLTATRRRVVVAYYSSTLVFRRRDPSGPWACEGQRVLVPVAVFRALLVEREAKPRAAQPERADLGEMPGWESAVEPQAVEGGSAVTGHSRGKTTHTGQRL